MRENRLNEIGPDKGGKMGRGVTGWSETGLGETRWEKLPNCYKSVSALATKYQNTTYRGNNLLISTIKIRVKIFSVCDAIKEQ